MSGLKTEIIEKLVIGGDHLCLDQYPDGSVRLICDQNHIRINDHGIAEFENRVMINLSKKEMMRLITVYLHEELQWGSLAEEEE